MTDPPPDDVCSEQVAVEPTMHGRAVDESYPIICPGDGDVAPMPPHRNPGGFSWVPCANALPENREMIRASVSLFMIIALDLRVRCPARRVHLALQLHPLAIKASSVQRPGSIAA